MLGDVIVIDDDHWAIEDIIASFRFEDWGFHLSATYSDVPSAWQHIVMDPPTLIISDIRMEKESGLDLAKRCHENKIPSTFVLVSGHSDFSYVQQAFESNVYYYLLKPLDDEKVSALMVRLHEELLITVEDRENWPESFSSSIAFIRDHFRDGISLASVADACYINKSYLAQMFSKYLKTTFTQYRNQLCIDYAKQRMRDGERNMTLLSGECGFEGLSQFSRTFKQMEGMSPIQYFSSIRV